MTDRPDNLTELLRRALAAQTELGAPEMVIGAHIAADSAQTARIFASADRIVSVREAMGMSSRGDVSQQGLDLSAEPEFASLAEHRAAICECQKCPLGKERNQFVYGVGNPDAQLMFVGEAPGAEEDRLGEPFVGRAGKLLDKILAAMETSRAEVYIANILKCRPPGNRDPLPDEMGHCFPYLREQVRLIKPKVICALGRIAAQAMLQCTTPLGKLRGHWHEFESVPMLVTYHPAALLRFPAYKKDTWADMQLVMERLKQME